MRASGRRPPCLPPPPQRRGECCGLSFCSTRFTFPTPRSSFSPPPSLCLLPSYHTFTWIFVTLCGLVQIYNSLIILLFFSFLREEKPAVLCFPPNCPALLPCVFNLGEKNAHPPRFLNLSFRSACTHVCACVCSVVNTMERAPVT